MLPLKFDVGCEEGPRPSPRPPLFPRPYPRPRPPALPRPVFVLVEALDVPPAVFPLLGGVVVDMVLFTYVLRRSSSHARFWFRRR